MKLTIHEFRLPLRHVFTISRESVAVQPTLIAELAQDEFRGFGEATSNAYYGMTIDRMRSDLERLRPWIESHDQIEPEDFWQQASTGTVRGSVCTLRT